MGLTIYFRKPGETQYWTVYPCRDEEEAARVTIGLMSMGYEVRR